ncbi:MAG: hypothetical protein ACI8ZM_000615 [Crocinitomix sp.]|jgi:hypothetical protein
MKWNLPVLNNVFYQIVFLCLYCWQNITKHQNVIVYECGQMKRKLKVTRGNVNDVTAFNNVEIKNVGKNHLVRK